MARFAGLGESLLHVIWIVRVLVVLQMARDAGRLSQVVIIVDMAIAALARRYCMRSGQRKIRLGVIEVCVPAVGRVARIASLGEAQRHVVGVLRALEVRLVAADAIRGHRVELAQRSRLVT